MCFMAVKMVATNCSYQIILREQTEEGFKNNCWKYLKDAKKPTKKPVNQHVLTWLRLVTVCQIYIPLSETEAS